ncbi:MAG: hypothetical protein DI539_26315 [Flavobacterium psychrophilum]|nr:MAG: hypothetical protein DI539_26315 [Flavobacterium psychrophilum]
MAEISVKNEGTAIANDIFIQLQTYKGDQVSLPFAVAYQISTNDSINWEIFIYSLAPDEQTGINMISPSVDKFLSMARDLKDRGILIPNGVPNIVSVDYREGKWGDVIPRKSPEFDSYLKTQLDSLL